MIRKLGGWVMLVLGLSPLAALSQDVVAEKQEVSARCAGLVLFVGAEVQSGEPRPQGQELEKAIEQGKYHRAEQFILVTEMIEGESASPGKTVTFPDNPKKKYRPINRDEPLAPDKIRLARVEFLCRRLEVGQAVQLGQFVALVDPKAAVADLVSKVAGFASAGADRAAAEKRRDDLRKQYDSIMQQQAPRTVSWEERINAERAWLHAVQDVAPKAAAVREAEYHLRSSLRQLRQHEVRAGLAGLVTALYKKRGETVETLEPVLQIQDPELQGSADRAQQRLLVQDFPTRFAWTQDPQVFVGARVAVTAKCDGLLLFIGVEVQPGESRPQGWRQKKAIEQGKYYRTERFFLVTEAAADEAVPAEQVKTFPENPKRKYRPITPKERLDPDRVRIARAEVLLRKLEVGQLVRSDQVLAVMDSALAGEELAIQAVRFVGAELERQQAQQTRDHTRRRFDLMIQSCAMSLPRPNAERREVYREAERIWMYFVHEEKLKASVVREEGQELRACLKRLHQHEVCAGRPGLVTELSRRPGEAIKAGEPIVRIQSPNR